RSSDLGNGDLVRRAPGVGRSSQDFARHLQEERIVVHRFGGAASDQGRRLTKGRVRLRADVAAKDMALRLGAAGIGRPVSGRLSRHEPFELAYGFPPRGLEPLPLGRWRRHARELSNGGPAQSAFIERAAERRKVLERDRGSEFVVRGSMAVAEQLFDVLRERGVAEVSVHPSAKGTEQREALATVELSALLGELLERVVCQNPFYFLLDPNPRLHERKHTPVFCVPRPAPRTRVWHSDRRASRFGAKDAPVCYLTTEKDHSRGVPATARAPVREKPVKKIAFDSRTSFCSLERIIGYGSAGEASPSAEQSTHVGEPR